MLSFIYSLIYQYFIICLIYRSIKALGPIIRAIRVWYIYPLLGWKLDCAKYVNKWTVMTGCTDGIGREYLRELGERGFRRFFLIGRNQQKLNDVKEMMLTKYNAAEVETYVFDFDVDSYDKLPIDKLQKLEVGLLVNCVGIAVDQLTPFTEQPFQTGSRIIRVNAMSAIHMTELVLPGMVARDCGIVVTVSSIQGWRPLPLLCTYPASKACVSFMSECLHLEYKHTNIKFQCLMPLLVATKMTRYSGEADGFVVVSPEYFAKQACDALGIMHIGTGCIIHDFQAAFLQFLPHCIAVRLMAPFYHYQARRFVEYERLHNMKKQ